MTPSKHEASIVLLACDALEAAEHEPAVAVVLLIDAALSILVTRHAKAGPRRELAGVLSRYVIEQVDTVIRVTGGAA